MSLPTYKTALLNRVKATIHQLSPEAEIILYGSRARETASTESERYSVIPLKKQIESCSYRLQETTQR